jgi:hypothetical protein
VSDPVPSNGSLICTFADCPDRVEELWDLETVEHSVGGRIDPDKCPLSLRNSDYSDCNFKDENGSYSRTRFFCEIAVREGDCPRGFRR